MRPYNHKTIESKWQKRWEDKKLYEASDDFSKKKYYPLIEFPYPSGDGLHVGHPRPYIALDIVARKRRAEGYNVLYPIGWDAFGLPTENYAIKTGTHPREVTKKNTDRFKSQVQSIGLSFDWSREINTTDPKYYKWTQWIFLQLFKHGFAYKKKMPINWCLDCKVGLANEEVVDGLCDRCDSKTEKREKEQWMLAITKYADRLHNDLDTVDYSDRIKIQQRNWIGRSTGVEINFGIKNSELRIKVFTTRPDTLFGATYIVIAPESELISGLKPQIANWDEVVQYIEQTKKKTEIERTAEGREKTGVELKGVKAVNPANNEEIPVWIADYVLAHYGTGAIMAVPAHDERDYEFTKRFKLPIVEVVSGGNIKEGAYLGEGTLINSGKFNSVDSIEAREAITDFVNGEKKVTYKLRDWVFSRQRYWGEPIPLVFCKDCKKQVEVFNSQFPISNQDSKFQIPNSKFTEGELLNPGWVAVPEEELPVELPDIEKYKTSEDGESPLANISEWVNTTCPKCGGDAKRETDTMPQWAGSSWYFLRYTDPHNDKELASKEKLQYWLGAGLSSRSSQSEGGVDWYNGGMEHTTLHLLYSRFWHKFLFDIGVVPSSEPYKKRTSHGLILAEGGEKMSKSKGNVINPDDIVEKVGADTLRLYEMFMGPFEQPIPWHTDNIAGVRRFLEKVWRLQDKVKSPRIPEQGSVRGRQKSNLKSDVLETLLHRTIKKVSEDIEELKFNTAISQMMILVNEMEKEHAVDGDHYKILLRLVAPFAPHMADEIWEVFGNEKSIHLEPWPVYDREKITPDTITIAVQVNGKVRGTIDVAVGLGEKGITENSLKLESIKKWTEGRGIERVIYVPDRLVNIVTETS